MNFATFLDPLREEARALAARCGRLQSHPAIAQAALRLGQVAESDAALHERPVVAALVGGTGVGKSQLFNALIGQPEASPTSGAERLKTKHPVIARRPAEQALLPDFGVGEVRFIDAPTPWLALADTPDLDGMEPRHREITERIILLADLVVFVVSPEKRANFALLETLRAWAGRKRWFFVLNQCDTIAEELAAVREDFDRRLRDLGFAPDDASRFLVSALAPERWDFPRLRDTLWREHPREAAAALAVDAVLGQVLHACEPAAMERIAVLEKEIAEKAEAVNRAIVQRVHDSIERRRLAERLIPVLRKQVWTSLPSRTGGPLALPVLIHARIAGLASAFQLWRLTTAGFSIWRLGMLAASLFAAMRGSIEVRGLVAQLDTELAAPLADLDAEISRFLADRQLAAIALADHDTALAHDLQQLAASVPGGAAAPLARVFGAMTLGAPQGRVARELVPLLTEAIEYRAEDAASRCVGFFSKALNILPLAALAHTAYEVFQTWAERDWLPGVFYLHAAAVFLLTLLPGYLLICVNVGRQLRRTETLSSILTATDKLPPCGPAQSLALLRADLAALLTGLAALRARAISVRHAINAEFAVRDLGTSKAEG